MSQENSVRSRQIGSSRAGLVEVLGRRDLDLGGGLRANSLLAAPNDEPLKDYKIARKRRAPKETIQWPENDEHHSETLKLKENNEHHSEIIQLRENNAHHSETRQPKEKDEHHSETLQLQENSEHHSETRQLQQKDEHHSKRLYKLHENKEHHSETRKLQQNNEQRHTFSRHLCRMHTDRLEAGQLA